MDQLKNFQDEINYKFKDETLLFTALTHTSYANEKRSKNLQHNERLEFLGDSVLSLIITDYLYSQKKKFSEGEQTRIRAAIVCEGSLKKAADKVNLGKYMYLGKGEEATGGRCRPSIVSDAFEATIAAIYLDGGFDEVRKVVTTIMEEIIGFAVKGELFKDYKTQLQELVQQKGSVKIEYQLENTVGPDHNKIFQVSVSVNGIKCGTGTGHTKKDAEREAAKHAIETLNEK